MKLKQTSLLIICLMVVQYLYAQQKIEPPLLLQSNNLTADTIKIQPLQQLYFLNVHAASFAVFDGEGKKYYSSSVHNINAFITGGALGKQTIRLYNSKNQTIDSLFFYVDATTNMDDGGYYKGMFQLFYKGMFADVKEGTFPVEWNGKTYHVIVPWVLDNFQTMKGLKYFLPNGRELIDIMRQSQRSDGMIYSFIQYMENADYFLTRDKFSGYSKLIGDKVFVRQPVENHPEYLYVNTIYDVWKSDDDTTWMKKNLTSAEKALDYAMNDPARWSNRFKLLKRAYTIDSWDFAVNDSYTPDIGITNTMIIDPEKTKFGVFFGDNTGYVEACYQLAEMLKAIKNTADAKKYSDRADTIKSRLDKLSWNGNFFTHFIDEDSTVHRDLGVDEKTQIAQSNAYSINRKISHEQSKGIIETYMHLKDHLPVGSPGEWYAIYPPFQHGFEQHNAIWQYMNGGVGGHVAGELSRGAYENGFENYATDILQRVYALGKKHGDKISFAYAGSIQPFTSVITYKTVDITAYANMDLLNTNKAAAHAWLNATKPGDDLKNLPTGKQQFNSIEFNIIDPSTNKRNAVIAVSNQKGFPSSIEIPINDTAASIYFLHTATKPESENIVGVIKIMYEDGSSNLHYIIMGKQLAYWWFPQLKTDSSGIAWHGKNDVSEGIGLSWCSIDNPQPNKKIKSISIEASQNNNIYAVLAVSLSYQKHYVPVNPVSFGGPDDWAAATNMAAMIEGLSGVKDAPKTEAFNEPIISPRWTTTQTDSINVTVRYAASKGYVSYQYKRDSLHNRITIIATTGGDKMLFHVLMPANKKTISVYADKEKVGFKQSTIEQSNYADFELPANSVKYVEVSY